MKKMLREVLKKIFQVCGYTVRKYVSEPLLDEDPVFQRVYAQCRDYTMTTKERMFALYQSVRYVVDANREGDFVECGVWRGGNTMLIALTLSELGVRDRKIYLYDTFEGMSAPTNEDTHLANEVDAHKVWKKEEKQGYNNWCYASLEEVKKNMASTGYPLDNVLYVKGKVEETLPKTIPQKISLLRLDTDWYESTKQELEYLFPILVRDGVLILDDHGYWSGSKQAVDEYFEKHDIKMLLTRIDANGYMGIKRG